MRHLHVVFIGVVFALVATILLSPTIGNSADEAAPVALERTYDVPADGVVCCTWIDGGREHSCVAASGQTCDICATACA